MRGALGTLNAAVSGPILCGDNRSRASEPVYPWTDSVPPGVWFSKTLMMVRLPLLSSMAPEARNRPEVPTGVKSGNQNDCCNKNKRITDFRLLEVGKKMWILRLTCINDRSLRLHKRDIIWLIIPLKVVVTRRSIPFLARIKGIRAMKQ